MWFTIINRVPTILKLHSEYKNMYKGTGGTGSPVMFFGFF